MFIFVVLVNFASGEIYKKRDDGRDEVDFFVGEFLFCGVW